MLVKACIMVRQPQMPYRYTTSNERKNVCIDHKRERLHVYNSNVRVWYILLLFKKMFVNEVGITIQVNVTHASTYFLW